jgi:GTP-binding protein
LYRNLPEVALVGRPNVGKATLFNRLLRKRRAITDPTSGVTHDPVAAGELTSADEEFIALLRPFQDRLLVVVNKTEGGRLEEYARNFSLCIPLFIKFDVMNVL